MGERQKRRRFTTEFKAEAVKRLLDGGKGLGEVATELGLSPGQLRGRLRSLRRRGERVARAGRLPVREGSSPSWRHAMWTAESRALVGDFGAGQALSDEQYALLEPLI